MERTDLDSIPETGRERWIRHIVAIAVLLAVGLVIFSALLSDDVGPLHRDFGTIFLSKMQQQVDALRDGKLLFWDPILYGGTAFWPLPNTAPAYPPLLLSFLVRGNALGGLNLALLLHILWGALGTYLLVHYLTGRSFPSLAAGLLFIMARYVVHLAFILPLDLMALAWVPWTLYFLVRGRREGNLLRAGLAAGLAYSPVTWVGGYNIFLYGLILCGLVVMAFSLKKPWLRSLGEGVFLLALFCVTFLVLSAGRLIPTAEWIPMTSRAEGLPYGFAARGMLSIEELAGWLGQEGWIPLALLILGLILGLTRRISGILPFCLSLAAIGVLASGILFPFLHEYVPGFSRTREPRRAVIMTPVLMPVIAGLVLAYGQSLLRFRRWPGLAAGAVILGLLAWDVVGLSDYERPAMHSLSERLSANAIHQELALRAEAETRFRIHDYEDTRINLKRTADLIRSALRLETLEAVLGNISVHDYDRDYFGASLTDPARLWGLMNCRYVTSSESLDHPGLELIDRFEEDRDEIKPGSDGPYLYRNKLEMPRAFLVDHAVLQIDDAPHDWRQWRAEVYSRMWNPSTTALMLAGPDRLEGLAAHTFDRFDLVISHGKADLEDGLASEVKRSSAAFVDLEEGDDNMTIFRKTKPFFKTMKKAHTPIRDPSRAWNGASITLPPDAGGRWLVLAETYAIYPGWKAWVDGSEVSLWRANGAATAIALPEGAREVELEYTPPGFWLGMILSLLALAVVLFLAGRWMMRALVDPMKTKETESLE
jgi:hypothetical protein